MADRFHFNPDTGRTAKCLAVHQCRFGQSDEQHGATRDEARANYESQMAPELFSNTASKSEEKPQLTASSTLVINELPKGMDKLVTLTGTNIRSYDPDGPVEHHKDYYIGGKHRLLDRARVVKLADGKKVWALPVDTDGVQSTIYLPMRQPIPAALKYTAEARAREKIHQEENRIWRENWQREKKAEAERKAAEEAQQKRIESTPYEVLSQEDRAVADKLTAEAEEKRWTKEPEPLTYYGPNGYNRGQVRDDENEILQKIRGIPDYNLMDYNNRVEELAQSELPREEQERQIREERMGYIQSMNSLLDQRMERAKTVRAERAGFRATLRSFFESDERDSRAREEAQNRVLRDRQSILEFASALFEAPPYTRIHFASPPRRF